MSLKQTITQAAINNLKQLRIKKSTSIYEFVKELSNVHGAINWKKSQWKSFKRFCEEELQFNHKTANAYVYQFHVIDKFGYTNAEIATLLQTFSFQKLYLICSKMKRKLKVPSIISRYKSTSYAVLKDEGNSNRKSNEEAFAFSLPPEYADKYKGILETHGMTYGAHNRVNVRQAMMNFLDTI